MTRILPRGRHGIAAFALAMAPVAAGPLAAAEAAASHYGITITTASTRHVAFHNGVYRPTAEGATLNVNDLKNALAAGNIEVTTGNGAAGKEMGDLHVEVSALTWSSKFALTLDAYHSIFIDEPVTDAGTGALTLTTNDGGTGGIFIYGPGDSITFSNVADALTINGQGYTLVGDIKSLAADITANPSGDYAVAANFGDGSGYQHAPITTTLTGVVNGLGNTIGKFTINDPTKLDSAGFFAEIGPTGVVQDLRLSIVVEITEPQLVGGLAATNLGTLVDDSVETGVKTSYAAQATLGGLVGANSGTIARCNASAAMNAQSESTLGGLVGVDSGGVIIESFAGGKLVSEATSALGGLVGTTSLTSIANSYSTASTTSPDGDAGGLVGVNGDANGNNGLIATSYAAGLVKMTKHSGTSGGGLIGIDNSVPGSITSSYWDTATSGISNPGRGAFSPSNDPGITAERGFAGLPAGFDPTIWAQNGSINNGLPYLIANPPQ